MLYQIRAVAKIRPIIRVISQAGVADVTAVAKTEINTPTALGLVRVTKNRNEKHFAHP